MRRAIYISILSCLCLGILPAKAQEGFFCSKDGTTLKWELRGPGGDLVGQCHETLVSMEGDPANRSAGIVYHYMFYDKKGRSVTGKAPFKFSVTVDNGKSSAYVSDIGKAIKSGDYMLVGDISSIPASLDVGDTIPDTEISINVKDVFKTSNRYTNKRIVAHETVETAAGSFDCYLLEDDEYYSGKGPFHVKSWVARGQGIIKQVIANQKGETTQIIERIP